MRSRNSRGFTLLEVLLGLSLTAVIFVILLSALRLGQRSQEKGDERDRLSQHLRVLNDRLSWLIRGAYPFYIKEENPDGMSTDTLVFTGSAGRMEFVTTSTDKYSAGLADLPGLKWVALFADDAGLRMAEDTFFMLGQGPEAEKGAFVLDPAVTEIAFEYLDLYAEEGEGWTSTWDTEQSPYLPAAVRVIVAVDIEGRQYSLPPVLVSIKAGNYQIRPPDTEPEGGF